MMSERFMNVHFDFSINKKSHEVLKKLVENSAYMNIKNVVIPLVDESSIKNCFENNKLIESFNKIMRIFEEFNIEASFELDMPPKDVITFIDNIESTKELLAEEKDPEMREMAKIELDELIQQVDPMEENIKFILLPAATIVFKS